MFANISIGQLCGFLFLFILLTSILSQFLAGAAPDPVDMTGTLSNVATNGRKFRISVFIDLISHISIIPRRVALHRLQPIQSDSGPPWNTLAGGGGHDHRPE